MVQVGILLGPVPERLGDWLADASAFDAAGADALWVEDVGDLDTVTLAAALSVVTFRARLVVATAQAPERSVDTVRRLSHGRLGDTADPAEWERVGVPQGREEWRQMCTEAHERGVRGVIVPADARLLDILRNPDDPGERHDLQLAQG
ncbi:MAG TPA: hypothetical protein VFV67_00700 [Actinophytocola sp.]|uniref:hypothetical protein n=1 Tax=Actinophytocola sp. TaxID=1872138 RepID=UPI002DB7F462|nr:hypothetical protein [Actinophytocola sp.]HEU5469142.1 hypothetical protein [Actinophytocola sp.]